MTSTQDSGKETTGPLAERTVDEALTTLAAKQPTPGGGAAAAISGATAVALGQMVVAYSLGRCDLAEHEAELRRASERLQRARSLFLQLAEEDAEAYSAVSELLKLDESDPRRSAQLPAAVAAATRVPMSAIAACVDLLRLFDRLSAISNRRLRSDLALAAVLAEASARASRWNVLVNAPLLRKTGGADLTADDAIAQTDDMLGQAREMLARIEQACGEKG